VITDFREGLDFLDMTNVTGLYSLSQLTLVDTQFGVGIEFGTNSVLLEGINADTLVAADFIFAPAPPVTVIAESADLNVAYADPSTATSGLHYALAGTGVQMVFGSDGNDVLDASGTADYNTMLYGGAGNDTLIPGSAGSYTLQGGPGDDTAVFSGNQSDYTIDGSPAGFLSWATVTDNATGAVYWLQSVENLQFADGTITPRGSRRATTSTLSCTSTPAIRPQLSAPPTTPSMSIIAAGPIRFTSTLPGPM
jgi:Ca2+-binding RTX toxin-like protein